MRVKDIWDEVVEATGTCDEKVNFRAITRAVELLANRGLFDPLIATIDFTVDGGFLIALPRDVKTPIRLNINNNPAFSRSRIFEFAPNTNGTNDGPEIGWQWHERGYACIQDERKLPSPLRYKVEAEADNGKTLKVRGIDPEGYERSETLIGALADPTPSQFTYAEVRSVTREATIAEAYLLAETGNIARYYFDEEQPEYRVIKLAQTGVAVRMLYRRHVFEITSQDDIIPLHSAMAVIRAVDAVRLMMKKKYADATAALEEAAGIIGLEQSTRDDAELLSGTMELQSATNTNINTNDVLIVADIYDMAAEIIGPVGRAKLFDRITDAVNALANKSQWESTLGVVDVMRAQNCGEIVPAGKRCRGDGYFVLPRYVGAVLAANTNGEPGIPRNRWFEFHLNGTGETKFASCGTWDDAGDVVIINQFPRGERCRIVPTKVLAIPDNALDADKSITIFGLERLSDGREVEVWRNNKPGWVCPCKADDYQLPNDAPAFVKIDRIKRDATIGFVRLVGFSEPKTFIALVGDIGRDNSASNGVAAFIKAQNPQDIILLGDNNYEIGSADTIDANIGKKFRTYIFPWQGNSTIAPLALGETDATANHLWPVLGNHDWGNIFPNNNGLNSIKAYTDYFTLPNNGRYYTKVFGDVQVFFLDSDPNEPDGNTIGSVQYQWLRARVAESTARWKVCVFHHTPRSAGIQHGSYTPMRWDFADMGIHAVVAAHNHNYERREEGGVLYFTAGTGASNLDGFQASPSQFSLVRIQTNGALFMEATRNSLKFTFKNTAGEILDTRELTNSTPASGELLLGYWYPDELEPKYRMIKVPGCCSQRLRLRYRKRTNKVTSLHDVLNLRSRLALENMLRALANQPTDPMKAQGYEALALQYLAEEQLAQNPIVAGGLQFDPGTSPGFNDNVQ